MSHAAQATAQTMSLLERAKAEVSMLKESLARETGAGGDESLVRPHMKKLAAAEALLQKAETCVRRVKHASGSSSRPPAPVSRSERASRALAVLMGAGPPAKLFVPVAPAHARPLLREAEIPELCQRATQTAKLGVGPILQPQGVGVGFMCENVFRAFLWFKPAHEAPSCVIPEHITVFGVDESGATRWSASKHAVFGVLTERANAAVRYFWAREAKAADAFVALAEWLALHRTMFSDKCEDRRLAFDASRGYFLPACVRSFDGPSGARFTRGSIPVRGNSNASYSRGQSGSGAQANAANAANTAAAQGSNGSRRA